jgi:oligopeptide transport system substrate-binding protein
MWKDELGIEVAVEREEWKVFLENMKQGNYHMVFSGVAGVPSARIYLEGFLADNPENYSNYQNEAYDRLIYRGSREMDPEKRLQIFQEAEKTLLIDCPVAPLFNPTSTYMIHPAVQNFPPSFTGFRPWEKMALDPNAD